MPVRAKFQCNTVEQTSDKPIDCLRWDSATKSNVPTGEVTWPRTYRFSPLYDHTIPEDERYARYTPSGELRITVDNPNVVFIPGAQYYLDFTPVDVEVPA